MAQHDYVIANGTGAAVRSDLNNALAAIVSQNSGATEPATTYAYQWWADTTTNLLKLRNSANSGWITLFQLDGEWSTIALENGSAAAPSIYFKDSGTDTGIYSPGTDQVAISTGGTGRLFVNASGNVGLGTSSPSFAAHISAAKNTSQLFVGITGLSSVDDYAQIGFGTGSTAAGSIRLGFDNPAGVTNTYLSFYNNNGSSVVERMRIDSSGRVGIGTTSPGSALNIANNTSTNAGGIRLQNATGGNIAALYTNIDNFYMGIAGAHVFTNYDNTSERARIDSSGRLLVGTSTARNNFFNTSGLGGPLQVEGANNQAGRNVSNTYGSATNEGPIITLAKHRSNSIGGNDVVANNDELGSITFQGSDGTQFVPGAYVQAFVDGTPGADDMPGRLVFSTTADGASSPTERMRIGADGMSQMFSANDTLQTRNSNGAGTTYAFIRGIYSATGTSAGGTTSFIVYTNGNVQNTNNSYGIISDAKVKENIVAASSQWSDIKNIKIRNFNLKAETGYETHRQIGVIAQEVEEVSPGLVYETPDRDEDGNDLGTVTKGVHASVLYMKAVKALQEAMERIEILEQRLADAGIT